MACFLACFGFCKKPRRRKIDSKGLPAIHVNSSSELKKRNRARYEPLDSEGINTTRKYVKSNPDFIDKPKEQLSTRVKKKVSFNLNVTAYEPLPKNTETDEEIEEVTASNFEENPLRNGAFPLNHRYQNWRDGYDEEDDDLELEKSDLSDGDINDLNDLDEEYGFHCNGNDSESPKEAEFSGKLSKFSQLYQDEDNTDHKENRNKQERSRYVSSVLSPIENLSQWKEIKTREASVLKHWRKENAALSSRPCKPRKQEIVDASLSNWVSPKHIAAPPSSPLEEQTLRGKSNIYNTLCELDEQLMYKGRILRSG